MGNCKDCKFWGAARPMRPDSYSPKKHCATVWTNHAASPAMISIGADIEHGDHPADLLTNPDFGCVLFEPREEQREPLQPISIIGVKAQDGPPPLIIATAEEYRAYFGTEPPPHWFDPVVTVIPIADAPKPLWLPPYPEQLEPGAALLEDAIDRSDWSKP
jgi:hypothetical protein